jgi:Arc/MetJ-type ribon-helix-helix transcriptional regulator
MPAITVELPDELFQFVDDNVRLGRFTDQGQYIAALVDAARCKRADIEAALLDGLRSGPAEEWTSVDWAEMRQRLIERHQKD